MGMKTILLTSHKTISSLFDITIRVPSDNTARIQEIHILIGHIICKYIDEEYEKLYPNKRTNTKWNKI